MGCLILRRIKFIYKLTYLNEAYVLVLMGIAAYLAAKIIYFCIKSFKLDKMFK